MQRGSVYRSSIHLPNWDRGGADTAPRPKYCIVLWDYPRVPYVQIVVASRLKGGGNMSRLKQLYEVTLPQHLGFQWPSIVDCRWVFSIVRSLLPDSDHKFVLPPDVMFQINLGLVAGLHLDVD